jgi:hypothetical protein
MLLALVGVVAAAVVVIGYGSLATEAELVALQLPYGDTSRAAPVRAVTDPAVAKSVEDAMAALNVPWSRLFSDLEQALLDQKETVALLQVEPDVERREIRIAAEASSLESALAYVRRLERSETLNFPHLDNHEVQLDQRETPIYFEMTALWEPDQ